jgi:hypothetical protein
MITIYLDHNIIDTFDRGDAAYIDPILKNKACQPIISIVSIDEIFRGGDRSRSTSNINSLKEMGVKYIHHGPDEGQMSIDELDYENMYQTWLGMQSEVKEFKDSVFSMLSGALSARDEEKVIQAVRRARPVKSRWINDNVAKFPDLREQMQAFTENPEQDERISELVSLKELLPFRAKEINNIRVKTVFWELIGRLTSSGDEALLALGEGIKEAIVSAKDVCDQIFIVLIWLNFFGYHSDSLDAITRTRSFFSDAEHGAYGIACDGVLTLDRRFARKLKAAIEALELETKVGADAKELLSLIADKSSSAG